MATWNVRPLGNPRYSVKESLVLAETTGLRIIDQTLSPGERVPWHLHPETDDYIICLRGVLEVRQTNPDRATLLKPLERYVVERREPHSTVNASDKEECQFLIIQGMGTVEFRGLPKLDTPGS